MQAVLGSHCSEQVDSRQALCEQRNTRLKMAGIALGALWHAGQISPNCDSCVTIVVVYRQKAPTRRCSQDVGDMQAFQTAEELEAEDSWYCSKCKRHVQANKKLDLWTVPEVLVVHLKRFFFTRLRRDKLDVKVEFPLEDWDLSAYLPKTQVKLPLTMDSWIWFSHTHAPPLHLAPFPFSKCASASLMSGSLLPNSLIRCALLL